MLVAVSPEQAAWLFIFHQLRARPALANMKIGRGNLPEFEPDEDNPNTIAADSLPAIIVQFADQSNQRTGFAEVGASEISALVTALYEGVNYRDDLQAEITAALNDKHGTEGAYSVDTAWIAPFSMPDVDRGRQYKQSGGRFFVLVRPA